MWNISNPILIFWSLDLETETGIQFKVYFFVKVDKIGRKLFELIGQDIFRVEGCIIPFPDILCCKD